jgi:hypothetical protein
MYIGSKSLDVLELDDDVFVVTNLALWETMRWYFG